MQLPVLGVVVRGNKVLCLILHHLHSSASVLPLSLIWWIKAGSKLPSPACFTKFVKCFGSFRCLPSSPNLLPFPSLQSSQGSYPFAQTSGPVSILHRLPAVISLSLQVNGGEGFELEANQAASRQDRPPGGYCQDQRPTAHQAGS